MYPIDRQVAIGAIQNFILFGDIELDAPGRRKAANAIQSLMEMLPVAKATWIPVTERLPEDDTEVIVSCTDDSGDSEFSYTTTGWHFKGIWVVGNERSYFVRAWMPLPEPWKGEADAEVH